MKVLFKIIIFITIFIIFSWVFFYTKDLLFAPTTNISSVCFKDNCFSVQLAITNAEHEKGLMFISKMGKNNGMLFVFSKENIYPFWMKNTLIPLDIIWINRDNKVVFINENSQPCPANETNCPLIDPNVKAFYVLEVNSGIVKEIEIKVGDKVEFKS